ncbi:hypothetical protein ABT369_38705 [Dactylosporangium sp. NPDC000244]|uniref:hypothetical protein n=1 Tax=Dactylosporangium sp. NPDC000244 TaxID=3154365 RepID=UPI00331CB5BF
MPEQPRIAEELAAVERLAVRLHEQFRPLAGDVLIFDDCLEIARFAVGTLRREVDAARERGIAEGLRQATEGWQPVARAIHDLTHDTDGYWVDGDLPAEEVRRMLYEALGAVPLVGPWEPAEQPTEERPCGEVELRQISSGNWVVGCSCGSVTVTRNETHARAKAAEHAPAEQPEPAPPCPKIAHESGVVLACTVEHSEPRSGMHANHHHRELWGEDDDRIIAEPARGGTPPASGPLTTEEATPDCVMPGVGWRLARDEDLHRPHAALNARGHLRGCRCEDCERDAERPEGGTQ